MSDVEARLKDMGFHLPKPAAPAANYVPYVIAGPMVFIAGQVPFLNGEKMHIGKLGEGFSIEDGRKAAQACALNVLAQIKTAVSGEWSRVLRCVKLGGFVNCTPAFTDHPAVINGASDIIAGALGDRGKHARFAVGAPSLPFGVAVEVDAIFEIKT